jgi:hypothetical protein
MNAFTCPTCKETFYRSFGGPLHQPGQAGGACISEAPVAQPEPIYAALAHAQAAFERDDIGALGTINEHVQPVVDAMLAWARRREARKPEPLSAVEREKLCEAIRGLAHHDHDEPLSWRPGQTKCEFSPKACRKCCPSCALIAAYEREQAGEGWRPEADRLLYRAGQLLSAYGSPGTDHQRLRIASEEWGMSAMDFQMRWTMSTEPPPNEERSR